MKKNKLLLACKQDQPARQQDHVLHSGCTDTLGSLACVLAVDKLLSDRVAGDFIERRAENKTVMSWLVLIGRRIWQTVTYSMTLHATTPFPRIVYRSQKRGRSSEINT